MRASIVLCDFAEQEQPGTGKVHMLGAGWSAIGPAPSPHAVVAFIKLAPEEILEKHQFTLRLMDSGGEPVITGAGSSLEQPLEFNGAFEAAPIPDLPPDSQLSVNFVINLQALPLAPGSYVWHLEIGDGPFRATASESFIVRSQHLGNAAGDPIIH
jgi:hypothetical protein